MCGRYSLSTPGDVVAELFELPTAPELAARYNIAPSQEASIVRLLPQESYRSLALATWGLAGVAGGDISSGSRLINARSESAGQKPSFRDSLRARRCLVPADGFFEWTHTPFGRQPYFFRRQDGRLLAFAGLWNSSVDRGRQCDSFVVLTTRANDLVAAVHDRMPVILEPQAFDRWLDPDLRTVKGWDDLFRPYPESPLLSYPVSSRVNSPAYDSPGCIEPISLPVQPELFS